MDEALAELNWLLDSIIYAENRRDSIPPERLLRVLMLQVLYTIGGELSLVEHIHTRCCFVGLRGWRGRPDMESLYLQQEPRPTVELGQAFFDRLLLLAQTGLREITVEDYNQFCLWYEKFRIPLKV
jgi:hypothetical protein